MKKIALFFSRAFFMATDEGFTTDLLSGGTFSQLLESGDVSLGMEESLIYPSSFSHQDHPKMLCFRDRPEMGFSETGAIAQKSGGYDSSSTSSSSSSSFSKSRVSEISKPKTLHAFRNSNTSFSCAENRQWSS